MDDRASDVIEAMKCPQETLDDPETRESAILRTSYLKVADVVCWDGDIWNAATQNCRAAFEGYELTRGDCDIPPQLWFLPGAGGDTLAPSLAIGADHGLVAMLVHCFTKADEPEHASADGIGRSLIFNRRDQPLLPVIRHMGIWWVDGVRHSWQQDENYDILAALRFMQMGFVGVERVVLPRHLRRQAELGRRPPLPEIKTVTLRRAAREERAKVGESEPREWSCQWIVGAHWRKQWLPSKGTHEPRYIQPYLKGDPEKPLRQPKGPVYVVSR